MIKEYPEVYFKKVERMTLSTKYGKKKIFNVIDALIKADFCVTEIYGMLPYVLELAEIAGISVLEATRCILTLHSHFSVEIHSLHKVINTLKDGASNSNCTVNYLLNQFYFVKTVARYNKIEFHKTISLICILNSNKECGVVLGEVLNKLYNQNYPICY